LSLSRRVSMRWAQEGKLAQWILAEGETRRKRDGKREKMGTEPMFGCWAYMEAPLSRVLV
jgi:hypothetical protein